MRSVLNARGLFGTIVAIGIKKRAVAPRFLSGMTRGFFQSYNSYQFSGRMSRRLRRNCFDFSSRRSLGLLPHEQNHFMNFYRYVKFQTVLQFARPQYRPDYSVALSVIRNQIGLGRKVVLLAHGGASVFANDIYDQISTNYQRSCNQLFFSPLSAPRNGHYLRNRNDRYLLHLIEQEGYTGIPESNWDGQFGEDEDMGDQHELSGYCTYANNSVAETAENSTSEIVEGNLSTFDGPVTVELTWNSPVNLDLSVVQPSDVLVNKESNTSEIGILAKSDISEQE